MHHKLHNMDDESVPLPCHVTCRNGVFQYVRRIPDDVAAAFATTRIQRSLRTRLPTEARLRAAQIDREVEEQFTRVRLKLGFEVAPAPNEGWTWPDWEAFVAWLKAAWLDEDLQLRAKAMRGRDFVGEGASPQTVWLDAAVIKERIALRKRLLVMSVAEYGRERGGYLQSYARRLGITISLTSPYHEQIMRACLTAELETLNVVFAREGGQRVVHPHPDTIIGPWRRQPEAIQAAAAVATVSDAARGCGKSLGDCIDEWIRDRVRLKKKVDSHLVNDMRATIKRFEDLSRVSDVGLVQRNHVIRFRDHLTDHAGYKVATVNKKVGFITTMVATAAGKGWVGRAIEGGIYIDVPEDEDQRDSYSREDLERIFAHPIFRSGERLTRAKACGELQFWLPLISCTHGLISSEILQLGPDTVCKHPDADVLCFRVTTAGGRAIKAFSRERYVPIRSELIALGLLDLVKYANTNGWRTLWEAVENRSGNISLTSNYFSAFWSDFSNATIGIREEQKSLYSLRHAFKDALDRAKISIEVKQALMGHSDPGTTGRYGAKRQPKPVDIKLLRRAIQKLDWDFLSEVRGSSQ